MKAYNLEAKTENLSFGPLSVISLGEKGRGRICVLIPCPEGIKNGDPVELGVTRSGAPKIIRSQTMGGDEWLARISTFNGYLRNANGNIRIPVKFKDMAKVISVGVGAFGDAGRVGTWIDSLVIVKDGAFLRVKPSRGEPYILLFNTEKVLKIEAEEASLAFDEKIPLDSGEKEFNEYWHLLKPSQS